MGPVAGDRPLRTVGAGTKGDAEYGWKAPLSLLSFGVTSSYG